MCVEVCRRHDRDRPKVSSSSESKRQSRTEEKRQKNEAATKKAGKKGKAKKTTRANTKGGVKTIAKKPATATCKTTKPRGLSVQASICTVIARTGKDESPKSKEFRYGNAAGLGAAKRLAIAWLKKH